MEMEMNKSNEKYVKAVEHLNKVLIMLNDVDDLDPDPTLHRSYIHMGVRNSLGNVLTAQEKYEECFAQFQLALDSKIAMFGEDDPRTGDGCYNIAEAYELQGIQMDHAVDYYRKAWKIYCTCFGEKYGEEGSDTAEAKECMERCMAACSKVF